MYNNKFCELHVHVALFTTKSALKIQRDQLHVSSSINSKVNTKLILNFSFPSIFNCSG